MYAHERISQYMLLDAFGRLAEAVKHVVVALIIKCFPIRASRES